MHPYSGTYESDQGPSRVSRAARRVFAALLCAVAVFVAGCGNNNDASGYGIAWVTLSDAPGDFTSYIVNVDSITLTRSDGAVVTALATVETVDFTKLSNYAELWGTATIPIGSYVSASIVLDYTPTNGANISVMVNGLPQQATVVDSTGLAVTTETINVILDPANPLVIAPTFATTAAQRLALDFNLAASTSSINYATSPATVTIKPYLTAAIAPPDNKMIRVRGPLINSSVDLGTYTVYVRPFFDEQNSLGSLTMFTTPSTVYTVNGVVSTGATGISQLSQSSAGTTVTAAFTTYTPTATPSATAAKYYANFVVAGSTLEDVYTQGLEGDVVARNGNTLTLRGSTLQLNDGISVYSTADATVILGPSTIVTADDNTSLTGLNYLSVGVGQHIIARGICDYSISTACSGVQQAPTGALTLDSTGSSATNTGSVRLIPTSLWGSLVAAASGSVQLDLATINDWPVTDFNFAGNGTSAAADPLAASYLVNTGAITVPDTTPGDSLFVDGIVTPFGSAPPDFTAISVNDELSVQTVGTPAAAVATTVAAVAGTCGIGTLRCQSASLRVYWSGAGTAAPFSSLTPGTSTAPGSAVIDLANANFSSGVIRIGAESINLTTLPASPIIVSTEPPTPLPGNADVAGSVPVTLTPVSLPAYSYGNPLAVAPLGINVFSSFATFATDLTAALPATPALQLEARGTYDRATNTFTAISVNVVL